MSKNDTLATNYMSVAERFADAVNVGVFHGKRIISPGQIVESASASKIVLKNKKNTKIDVGQMYRDVVKKVIYDMNFCIIGVENQNEIHYVFPIRSMLYDAVTYKKQWNEIKREHKKKKI